MKETCPDGNQPLRTVPEVSSKKLLKFLQQVKLSDRWVQLVPLDGGQEMARWKTMIDYGITRDEHGCWYKTYNSSVIFTSFD